MKLGDKKQAIALGIVAVLALGMLGKTAFGALSTTGGSKRIAVKDVGEPTANTSPTIGETAPQALPEKSGSETPDTPAVDLSTIKRDAFDVPDVPEKTKSFGDGQKAPNRGNESYSETKKITPWDPGTEQTERVGGTLPGSTSVEKPPEKSDNSKASKPEISFQTARYDGFVDAGSPMGIVSIDGNSLSVGVGNSLGNGYTVESISSQRITIRKGKVTKTILIGKETKI